MDNSNNEQQENTGYGWRENGPPPPKSKGSGSKILFAVAGVLLIVGGVFGLAIAAIIPFMAVSVVSPIVQSVVSPVVQSVSDTVTITAQEIVTASNSPFITQRFQNANGATVLESQVPLAEFNTNRISISAAAADVIIWGHDADTLDITIEMYNDITYDVTFAGGSVIIDNDDIFRKNLGKSLSKVKADKLLIKVPNSYTGDLSIELAAGKADVSGISGDRLTIEMAAGDFTIANLGYNTFRLEMAAGSLEGDNISADNLNINMTAGTVILSGDLGTTNCSAAAGSVSLDYNSMPSSIKIDAAAGSADIFLPADSQFRLRNSSVMGGLSNDFAIYPDSANEISIGMAMGQVKIHKK